MIEFCNALNHKLNDIVLKLERISHFIKIVRAFCMGVTQLDYPL